MAEPDAGRDSIMYTAGIRVLGSSGETAPFWLQANRHGEISSLPHSGNIQLGVYKKATRPNRWYDYDFGVVLSGRIAGTQAYPTPRRIEGTGYFSLLYAHVRLYIVDITAGIKPFSIDLGDEDLSTGHLLFSNNVHPIPRLSIGIERWTAFPGLFGYVEIKGGLTHGWLDDHNTYVHKTMLHHKYIGGRIGGKLPVNLSYEFHHAAQWGGYSSSGIDHGNDWASYMNIFFGRKGGATRSDQLNVQGNHMLSQLLCLTVKGSGWHVDLFWQNIQEDGGISFIGGRANAADGRWGIYATQDKWPFISGFRFEILQTTDQSGPWHDRDGMVFGGVDNYYSNGTYGQGWTYFGRTIGSSLMTPLNNRVWAYHGGVKGDIYGFRYRVMVTYADNYGTYREPIRSHNTAVLLEVKKHVPQAWGMEFGLSLAGDFGNQYGNQFGAMLTICKKGIIHSY